MVNVAHIWKGQIQDHMPVVGSDGRPFGTVDHLAGDYIKLTRNDAEVGGIHRYLPLSMVAGLDGGVVRLSMPAAQVKQACLSEGEVQRRLSLNPDKRVRFDKPRGDRAVKQHGTSGAAPGPAARLSLGTCSINS